eukprot:5075294-Amphidinium_carterae.1
MAKNLQSKSSMPSYQSSTSNSCNKRSPHKPQKTDHTCPSRECQNAENFLGLAQFAITRKSSYTLKNVARYSFECKRDLAIKTRKTQSL